MYDLRIGSERQPEFAIEVVAAVNPTWIQTWNEGPAKAPWEVPSIGRGGAPSCATTDDLPSLASHELEIFIEPAQ